MAVTVGRVTIDDRGIRQKPFLFFFGAPFDLAWADITSWASVDAVLASPEGEAVAYRILELQTPGELHSIRLPGSDAGFGRIVEEVRRRLPEKQAQSILAQIRPGAYR